MFEASLFNEKVSTPGISEWIKDPVFFAESGWHKKTISDQIRVRNTGFTDISVRVGFFYINLQHRETITFRENLKQHNYVYRGAIFSYGNLLQTQFRPNDFLSVIFRVIGCLHLVRKCYKKILMAQHQLTYLSRIRIRSYLVCFDPDPDPRIRIKKRITLIRNTGI